MVVSSPQKNFIFYVKLMESRDNSLLLEHLSEKGIAERRNIIAQEDARTMLNEARLSNGYWREAISTTVHILNRGQL